nr:hypothetical protein Iba_chr05bCG8210 [Ipomoea batatas]
MPIQISNSPNAQYKIENKKCIALNPLIPNPRISVIHNSFPNRRFSGFARRHDGPPASLYSLAPDAPQPITVRARQAEGIENFFLLKIVLLDGQNL